MTKLVNIFIQDGEYAVHIAVRVEKGLEKMKMLLQNRADRNAARMVSVCESRNWLGLYLF